MDGLNEHIRMRWDEMGWMDPWNMLMDLLTVVVVILHRCFQYLLVVPPPSCD